MAHLRSLHEADFDEVISFLREREWRCVTLMSHLLRDGKPFFPARSFHAFARLGETAHSPIEGVLFATGNGILLHCLGESLGELPGAANDPAGNRSQIAINGALHGEPHGAMPRGSATPVSGGAARYEHLIARLFARAPVRCVIGSRDESLFLESLLPGKAVRAVDYRLMKFDPSTVPPPAVPGVTLHIARCGTNETDALFPLQEGYEREEVMGPDDLLDREAVRATLRVNLGKQHIYAVFDGERPVAKAGTNALGLGWSQLGGVYTVPEWRGKGLAPALVRHIADEERRRGKSVCLFVKTMNDPALKAYGRAGFKPDGFFRISYW